MNKFLKKLNKKKKLVRISMFGLDKAGKTTILYKLKNTNDFPEKIVPTISNQSLFCLNGSILSTRLQYRKNKIQKHQF